MLYPEGLCKNIDLGMAGKDTMKKKYLFADKTKNNSYLASEIFTELNNKLWDLEYGDVIAGQYQIWEYPSGKVFDIESDRNNLRSDDYSTPDPEHWLPRLKLVAVDKGLVNSSYEHLASISQSKFPRSYFTRLKKYIKK